MPAGKVQLNYDDLLGIRERFSRNGDVVSQMIQNLRAKMDVLENGGWVGRGAQAFYNEMHNEVLPALERLRAAQGDHTVQQLQAIIDRGHAAEEQAGNLFKRSQ
jgi:WXG100 family type VII secretion target